MTRNGVELTEAEKLAKTYFMRIYGSWEDLYKEDESSTPTSLPDWYDEELYKTGQKFFKDNRAGILFSNYLGLITGLAEPRIINIVKFGGRYQTPYAARQRNIAILVHTLSWYKYDLSPGSKSLKSLIRVRKIHRFASKVMHSQGKPGILQSDLSSTALGFMGIFLARPNLFPVRINKEEELKGFVHFWAVICHVIGIKKEYNFCLLPLDALIIYCQMALRYIYLPLIQIQNSEYEELIRAVTVGMKKYLIDVDFDVDLFTVKRLLIVPGYQVNTNYKTEVLCRSILNQDDADLLNSVHKDLLFSVDIPIIEVTKDQEKITVQEAFYLQIPLISQMELKPGESVKVRMVNYEKDWQSCLNSSKYDELPLMTKMGIIRKDLINGIGHNFFGRFLTDKVLNLAIAGMKYAHKRMKVPITEDNKWIKQAPT